MNLRTRITALLWVVLCLYGVVFVANFWADHRGRGVDRPIVAQATDIACERNWLLLGLRWSCTATVIVAGERYPFSNDSSLLTPDDVGQSVAMVEVPRRRGGPFLTTARDDFDPRPWDGAAMLVLGVAGIVGGLLLWPWQKGTPEPVPPDRIRRMRRTALVCYGLAAAVLLGSWLTWGAVLADRDGNRGVRFHGYRGTATACSRDPWFLWLSWSCDVRVLSPEEPFTKIREERTVRIDHSQFTPSDIATPRPLSMKPRFGPFGPSQAFTRSDLPRPPRLADLALSGPLWALIALAFAESNRGRAGRLERASLHNPNIRPTER